MSGCRTRSARLLAAARAAATVVRQLTLWTVAARRIWSPSARGPWPRGVFTTRSILPAAMSCTASTPGPRASPCDAAAPASRPGAGRAWPRPCRPGRRGPRGGRRCRSVATSAKPEVGEAPGHRRRRRPCRGRRARRTPCPPAGSGLPAAVWLLAKASPKLASMPITSPVERISGPRTVSTSGKRLKGSTASFTATCPPVDRLAQEPLGPQLGQRGAQHHPGRHLGQRHAGGLGHEGHRAAGPGVGLDHEHLALLHRVLHVDEAAHVEGLGDGPGVALDAPRSPAAAAWAAGWRRPSRPSARRPPRRAPSPRRSAPRRWRRGWRRRRPRRRPPGSGRSARGARR